MMICNTDTPIYNTTIIEGVDNIKHFTMYDDEGVDIIDITGATATFAIKSKLERKEFVCPIVDNQMVLTIPNTEVFLSKTYTHRLELTLNGTKSRLLTGEIYIEKDV